MPRKSIKLSEALAQLSFGYLLVEIKRPVQEIEKKLVFHRFRRKKLENVILSSAVVWWQGYYYFASL